MKSKKYILENTSVKSEERFFGDHYPEFLEVEKNAWHYSKKEAEAKLKINLNNVWVAKPIQESQ